MKAVLRGKFTALTAHIKKKEKAHITDLTTSLKDLEQIEDWNQQNRKKENNTKNQWNKELGLWENQRDRQTRIQTNQKTEKEHPN